MTWESIKRIRSDMSDYVLHCTRERYCAGSNLEAFDVLKQILQDGFLKATFAIRQSWSSNHIGPTVRGPYRAVCFTEQPLRFFVQSIEASKRRYTEFAVAIRKDELFKYGGRPVIHSDDAILGKLLTDAEKTEKGYPEAAWVYKDGLPESVQYLWVGYDPTAIWKASRRGHPVDWTHEREWRVRPDRDNNSEVGLAGGTDLGKVVPIHLPDRSGRLPDRPHFVILVGTDTQTGELADWIQANCAEISRRGRYWQNYAHVLSMSQIISFEKVRASGQLLGRVEDFLQIEE